jgi:integrase
MKVKFSEAWVRKVAPPADKERETHQDTSTPGLYLRVGRSGERIYYATLWQRESRKVAWERIAPVGAISLENARDRVKKLRGVMVDGVDIALNRAIRRGEPTLGELIDGYYAARSARSDRAVEQDREQLYQRYLGKLPDTAPRRHGRKRTKGPGGVDWSDRPVSSITSEQVENLVSAIGAHRRIAGRVAELLHAAYEWGITKRTPRLAVINPARGVDAPNSKQRKRFARTDELPRLLAEINRCAQPWKDLFIVLLFVGFRRGATQAMKWTDIDFTAKHWHIPESDSKNKEPVLVSLEGRALEVLRRRARKKEHPIWVFPGGTKAGHVGRPKQAWAALLKRGGIEDLHPHDLRRTLGSHLGARGASQATIAKALGHRDIRSAAVYTQIDHEPVRRELREVHKAFEASGKRRRK